MILLFAILLISNLFAVAMPDKFGLNNRATRNRNPTSDNSVETIISNFNPKTFLAEINTFSGKKQVKSIKKAIENGHLNDLMRKSQFMQKITRFKSLGPYIIKHSINSGNLGDLALILKSGVKPSLIEEIKKAASLGRLDMVVEMAHYASKGELFEAFKQVTTHAQGIDHLESLLRQTESNKGIRTVWIEYSMIASIDGNVAQLKIFLKHLNSANDDFYKSMMHSLRKTEAFSRHPSAANSKNWVRFVVLNYLFHKTILIRYSESLKLLSADMINMFEGQDVATISEFVRPFSSLMKAQLIIVGGVKGDLNILQATLKFKSEFPLNLIDKVERSAIILLEKLAKENRWDTILELSRDFPNQVFTIIKVLAPNAERAKIFKSFLKKLQGDPLDVRYLFLFFKNLASKNDINLIQVFFENDQLWKIKDFPPNRQFDDLAFRHPDPAFWMLLHGIMGASLYRHEEMVDFLMSQMGNQITDGDNMLLKVAAISGRVSLVEKLLRHDLVIDAWPSDLWFDHTISEAEKRHKVKIVEILELAKALKPNQYPSAAAAK